RRRRDRPRPVRLRRRRAGTGARHLRGCRGMPADPAAGLGAEPVTAAALMRRTTMRRALLLALLFVPLRLALAQPLWQTLPPTPPPVPGEHTGHAKVNGISLYYATIGQGPPVVLLHGGLANSDYWGKQVPVLAQHHTVILVDSRGHGRSTRDA